jgi:dihydroxy-acid dehydratase
VTGALRSGRWFVGDDEVAVLHRVAARNAGIDPAPNGERPVIGIANSASDLNPCNLPLTALAADVAAGIRAAGGVAMEFPVMSLGEDLMKPSAMLYRNLVAMEVEEYLRSYPLDGVVLLANCDKSVPSAIMGATSADLPALVLTAGPRPVPHWNGRRVGTGTDLWRAWESHRTGAMSDADWAAFEACLACGLGACNTMGTASSMAIVTELLGLMLPGTAAIPASDPARAAAAVATGERIVAMVRDDVRPSQVLTQAAFANAVRGLHAIGGSTNVVLHLLAIAGRAGVPLRLDDVGRLGAGIPVVADVEPSGALLMQEFHAAGAVPALVAELAEHFDLGAVTGSGRTWADESAGAAVAGPAIRPADRPLAHDGAFAVVRGSLAPGGGLLKTSAASPRLFRHRGPAVVFRSYDEMRERIDDPALEVTAQSVLVLSGAGPVAVPGMPEWGHMPVPARLAAQGVEDIVRITDGRISGTAFGTCIVHVAPEAGVGGPLALVRDGDPIALDVAGGTLDLEIGAEALAERRAAWREPAREHTRGWPALYQAHVTQADEGCDFDFLQAPAREAPRMIEPVIGRS